MSANKRLLIKIIILGDSGVGKTSLLRRYVENKFSSSYKATIGSDFMTKDIQIDNHLVNLQIWDTAGQERFMSLGVSFFRGSDACILVYDCTVEKTFENLEVWKNQFLSQAQPPNADEFPFVILGNKIDMQDQRSVTQKRALSYCQQNRNIPYFEVSAKDSTNVEQAFLLIAQNAVRAATEKGDGPPDYDPDWTTPPPSNNNSRVCC